MFEVSQYTEVSLIGVALLVTILIADHKNHAKRSSDIHQKYINMIIINILILLFDISIFALQGISESAMVFLSYILCIACFMLHTWFGYEWLCYFIDFVYPRYQLTKIGRMLLLLPSFLCNVFVLMTPLNGWIFYFTQENIYQRGPLVHLTFFIDTVYLVACTCILVHEYFNPNAIRHKNEYLSLLHVPIPIFIGSLLQILFDDLPIVWIASALSLMVIYIKDQNQYSCRDALTNLYNRRQTDAQLSWELSRKRPEGDYLIVSIIDIDSFKKINDTYGHLIGDEALVLVAQMLQDNFRKTDFIGRYGGDEFLLIGHTKKKNDANTIFRRFKKTLDAMNFSGSLPYNLSASIGYVVCEPNTHLTVDEVLAQADAKMYEVKSRREKAYEKSNTNFTGSISCIQSNRMKEK